MNRVPSKYLSYRPPLIPPPEILRMSSKRKAPTADAVDGNASKRRKLPVRDEHVIFSLCSFVAGTHNRPLRNEMVKMFNR